MLRLVAILLFAAAPAFAQVGQRTYDRDTLNIQPPPLQIYIAEAGQQIGPLDASGFQAHLGTPEAASTTLVWMPGMANWELASTVPQLQGIIAAIGQADVPPDQFSVSDIQSYMLGVWITEQFSWPQNDIPYSSIIQMKVLPDGRFEGATLFWDKDDPNLPMRVEHEKGTWSVSQTPDGAYNFDRNITSAIVIGNEVLSTGQWSDTLVFTPQGPNAFRTVENIDVVRVPEAN